MLTPLGAMAARYWVLFPGKELSGATLGVSLGSPCKPNAELYFHFLPLSKKEKSSPDFLWLTQTGPNIVFHKSYVVEGRLSKSRERSY